jgi:hypothetical protein
VIDPRIAALAEALPGWMSEHPIGCTEDELRRDIAAAILAALDGWDLVRVDNLGRQIVGLYMVERDEALAEIARLRNNVFILSEEMLRLRPIEEAARAWDAAKEAFFHATEDAADYDPIAEGRWKIAGGKFHDAEVALRAALGEDRVDPGAPTGAPSVR